MLRGHTPKNESSAAKAQSNYLKQSFGSDFTAKLKSNRRHEYNGSWRKENGQGEASLRRFKNKKSEALKTRMK